MIPHTYAKWGWLVRWEVKDWGDDNSPSSSEDVVTVVGNWGVA